MSTLAKIQNVSVCAQGKAILENITLSIGTRDFITIIGPNGAGKSLLLKCIMGFYAPTFGTVWRKKSLKIGYIPQHLGSEHGVPITTHKFLCLRKRYNQANFQQMVKATSIHGILEKQLSHLSTGELQRVLLARSLLGNPELLVLDEAEQHLDISGRLAFYKLLNHIYAEQKISILMVSHDLHTVMATSKQVICLYRHVCCRGKPHMVAKDPKFIALFGSEISKVLAVYQHTHDHKHGLE